MYMNTLIWLQEPKVDLFQLSDYIMQDSIYYARKTAQNINEKVQVLKSFPYMGRIVPEINHYSNIFLKNCSLEIPLGLLLRFKQYKHSGSLVI